MANISISIDDFLLFQVMQRSHEQGKTLDEFVIQALKKSVAAGTEALPLTVAEEGTVDLADVLESAIQGVLKLPLNHTFYLSDVCPTGDWEAMTPGNRKSLGKKFRVRTEELKIAVWLRKTSNNHALYQRIG